MMSYADLAAPSMTEPSTTVAQLSITRMQDPKNPMPPDGASPDDVAVLEAWYAAGMPQSTEVCDATAAKSVYDTPSVCTSNKKWAGGNRRSDLMRPGGACIGCHDTDGGPSYVAAGTVYATAHEPDDCNGTSTVVQVVITDATGKKFTRIVNSVGNFFFPSTDNIKMPYKAKVVSGSKTRSMSTAQTSGDCNKCHSENGTKSTTQKEKAPGRVMAP
jgi:nitrate/TMAO reductase-like tetraheme cytochrome c subunit